MHRYLTIFFLIAASLLCSCRRSVHRPHDPYMPVMTTHWSDTPEKTYLLKNSHIEPTIFNIYDHDYFEEHRLPTRIPTRHDLHTSLDTTQLIEDLEQVVAQLSASKKKIKKLDHFIILKQRDYNYVKHTGLMVIRHKEFPFVVKLFMETPNNFVKPFNRGVEECAFFVMGGGMSRYLAGFTRIPNREIINDRIENNRYWKTLIDTPRKWYWRPAQVRYFDVLGDNIGDKPQAMSLPGIYAIICDTIESDGYFTLLKRKDREIAISITEFLGMRIDPHINNFIIEKDSKKIVIIDTEHFPTLIGIKDYFKINDFMTYYMRLAFKFFNNKLTFDRKTRIELQTNPKIPAYPLLEK